MQKLVGEMFIEQLIKGNSIRMNIMGRSMHPFIKKSDIITVKPINFTETRIGDVIACRRDPADCVLTVHRVIKKKREFIVTKGDANRNGDPPVYPMDICGKVISIERNGKTIDLETRFSRLSAYIIVFLSWGSAVFMEVLVYPGLVIRKIFKNP